MAAVERDVRREETAWRGLRALRYAAGGTAVVVVPERGGKIASIRDGAGREWLAQGDGRPPADPDTPFDSAEMCGWDECVPTIEASATSRGRVAADHGDVWNRPWREVAPDRLSIDIPSVDATVERAVAISDEGVLTLTYRVEAGPDGAAVLWAAHPLLRVGAEDRLVVDARTPLWAVTAEGAEREQCDADVSLRADRRPGESAKFYTDPQERPRWARIERLRGGGLHVSWEGTAIRTLGIWIDRAGYATEDVVALEPATGWYDSLERAERSGHVLRLAAGGRAEWSVSLTPVLPTRR